MKRLRLCLWLAGVNLFISAFTFGGGYVVIPMIRKSFVEKRGLFLEEDLMDMAAVAQSSPGAIAVNLAALAGYRVAGFPGAAVSCIAAVTPALVILSAVSLVYATFRDSRLAAAVLKGMEAGVLALIVDLVIDMYRTVTRRGGLILKALPILSFVAAAGLGVNVAVVLAASVCLVLAVHFASAWRGEGKSES